MRRKKSPSRSDTLEPDNHGTRLDWEAGSEFSRARSRLQARPPTRA